MDRVNGKCSHGVYWPATDPINLGCQQCNPDGIAPGPEPVLPRSSSDALMQRIVPVTNCATCGNVRTYSVSACRLCGTPFPPSDLRGRVQSSANLKQLGTCPKCSSSIHYETKNKKKWQCSDCDEIFTAPKRVGDEANDELTGI